MGSQRVRQTEQLILPLQLIIMASQVALVEKNLPAMQILVQSLGWEDTLETGMSAHSSILAWRIPWTEEPGKLHSPWGHKESDTTERLTLLLSLAAQNNRRSCVGAGGVVSSCLIGILPLLSCFSRVRPCATPWTVAARLLCPWGFSWQEYQSGLPCPPSGNLPGPGIELESSACRQIFNS